MKLTSQPYRVMPAQAGIHDFLSFDIRPMPVKTPKPQSQKSLLVPQAGRLFFKKEPLPS
jgi:hypothetical protein